MIGGCKKQLTFHAFEWQFKMPLFSSKNLPPPLLSSKALHFFSEVTSKKCDPVKASYIMPYGAEIKLSSG